MASIPVINHHELAAIIIVASMVDPDSVADPTAKMGIQAAKSLIEVTEREDGMFDHRLLGGGFQILDG